MKYIYVFLFLVIVYLFTIYALDRSEVVTCLKLQKQKTGYELFYPTRAEKLMCEQHQIKL
jgi:hypothetical protein